MIAVCMVYIYNYVYIHICNLHYILINTRVPSKGMHHSFKYFLDAVSGPRWESDARYTQG